MGKRDSFKMGFRGINDQVNRYSPLICQEFGERKSKGRFLIGDELLVIWL